MPRPALQQEEIDVFRDRLCEAATRRFVEHGVAGMSMRGLARELGCSATTPYRYFRNKEEIFASVRARAFERLAEVCEEETAEERAPDRKLAALGHAYLRFAREEPHAYRVAFELGQPAAGEYPELLAKRLRAWSVIRDAVEEAFAQGLLEGDPETVSHLYWAGLHGLAALQLAGQLRARDLDHLAGPMIQALLRGTRIQSDESEKRNE